MKATAAEQQQSATGATRRWRLPMLAGLLLLLLLLPLVVPRFYVYVAIDILIFALFATSLNLVMGYGGMVSFGHAAYFGIGAYTAALLYTRAGISMAGGLLLGPLAALLAGLVFGYFCVRLTSIYFAMLTLAFAQATYTIIFQWYSLTKGDTGIAGVWPPDVLLSPVNYYYLSAAVVVACLVALYLIVNSPFGYVMQAIRENPRRTRLIGIDVRLYQLVAFTISAFFSGVAGVLFVFERGGAYPDYAFVNNSITPIVMTIIGGMHHFLGPAVGSVVFILLQITITRYTNYWQWVLGAILLLAVIAFPAGVAGFAQAQWLRWSYRRRQRRQRKETAA